MGEWVVGGEVSDRNRGSQIASQAGWKFYLHNYRGVFLSRPHGDEKISAIEFHSLGKILFPM